MSAKHKIDLNPADKWAIPFIEKWCLNNLYVIDDDNHKQAFYNFQTFILEDRQRSREMHPNIKLINIIDDLRNRLKEAGASYVNGEYHFSRESDLTFFLLRWS